MVLAVIQPFKLDTVVLALEALPHFGGLTVTECRGFGHGKADLEARDELVTQSDVVDFTAKVRIEIAVSDREQADRVIDVLARTAHTGNLGDGKIFSWPLARAVRIRTFSEGSAAL